MDGQRSRKVQRSGARSLNPSHGDAHQDGARVRDWRRGFDVRIGDVVMGGGFAKPGIGRKVFGVDVANYGKTPALLTHYDVQFETFKRVKTDPPLKITRQYKHFDWLAPGSGKRLDEIDIPPGKDVVFGGFWYLDFQKQEHCFRFILTIDDTTTHPNIADEVDASYTYWD
jgi:hypothetical protein